MIKVFEKYEAEDKANKENIDSRNQLKNYIYQMKNSLSNKGKLGEKIRSEDKGKIFDALSEVQDQFNTNQDAEKDDFESMLKELQSVFYPIVSKVYLGAGRDGQTEGADDEIF